MATRQEKAQALVSAVALSAGVEFESLAEFAKNYLFPVAPEKKLDVPKELGKWTRDFIEAQLGNIPAVETEFRDSLRKLLDVPNTRQRNIDDIIAERKARADARAAKVKEEATTMYSKLLEKARERQQAMENPVNHEGERADV